MIEIPDEAVDAVAKSMYGEAEYDALSEDSQAKGQLPQARTRTVDRRLWPAANARSRANAQAGGAERPQDRTFAML